MACHSTLTGIEDFEGVTDVVIKIIEQAVSEACTDDCTKRDIPKCGVGKFLAESLVAAELGKQIQAKADCHSPSEAIVAHLKGAYAEKYGIDIPHNR